MNKISATIQSASKIFEMITKNFCALSLMAMIIVVNIGVFFRYVIGSSLPWTPEISRYLLVWLSLIGASLAYEKNEHVSVSYFYNKMPIKIKKILYFIRILLIGYFAYVMVSAGYIFSDTMARGTFSNIPGYVPRSAVVVSGIFIIIFTIGKIDSFMRGEKQQ